MFGPVFLLPLLFAAAEEDEKEEQKRDIALAQLKEKIGNEKAYVLANQALSWKDDKDIVATYDKVLEGKFSFDSMEKNSTCRAQEIDIGDFFAFLSQMLGKKETVRIIEEKELFKRTLEKHPERICDFILALNYHDSSIGRYEDGYIIERDIFQNRKALFFRFCPTQREPSCPSLHQNVYMVISRFRQEIFLELLDQKMRTKPLKTALSEDIVVPAMIIASGNKRTLADYKAFLMKPTSTYEPNRKQIKAIFELAKEEAQKPEYQELFVGACQAVKPRRILGISFSSHIDVKGKYTCPIFEKTFSNLSKTHE